MVEWIFPTLCETVEGVCCFLFIWSIMSSLWMKAEYWSGKMCNAMSIWKVLLHYFMYHYSMNHRFMMFPWLFNRLKLDITVFQAQSFTIPQSFRLPLNFSLGFENSFRIKLAVATELWHFNRNHQMTFKHDHVVLQCQNWFGVKIVPSGSVVQEGHKMQTVYLKITYIGLFLCLSGGATFVSWTWSSECL